MARTKTAAAALPGIPVRIPSILGNIPVVRDPDLMDEGNLGCFSGPTRTITIQDELDPVTAWATLWHEVMHLILWDSGNSNHITGPNAEALCDAFGTFMTVAMQKGFLQVVTKETK